MNIKDVISTDDCIDVDIELTREDMRMIGMEGTLDPVAAAARVEELMQKGSVLLQAASTALPGFALPELSAALDAMTMEEMASIVHSGSTAALSTVKPEALTVATSADPTDVDDGAKDLLPIPAGKPDQLHHHA